MSNILLLKRRIQVAQNVSKTTRAMQMIAASKLKRAQDQAILSRPYVAKLTQISQNVATKVDKENIHEYMKQKTGDKTLIIVISPDKGLCGSLVSNLIRESLQMDIPNTFYITLGKKAEINMASQNREIIASFPFGTILPLFEIVFPVLKIIDEYFLSGKVSNVKILSSKFLSVFSQKPVVTNLLPVEITSTELQQGKDMIFEPNLQELLPDLLRHFLEMTIYQNVLESYASEQAARMIAMKNATDNAGDIIVDLKLEYNKSRQEKITNEILDIGGATFALKYEE